MDEQQAAELITYIKGSFTDYYGNKLHITEVEDRMLKIGKIIAGWETREAQSPTDEGVKILKDALTRIILGKRVYGDHPLIKSASKALSKYESINPSGAAPAFKCPSCGKPWDTEKHKACECGATISAGAAPQAGKILAHPNCPIGPDGKDKAVFIDGERGGAEILEKALVHILMGAHVYGRDHPLITAAGKALTEYRNSQPPDPPAAGPVDYKAIIRQMMEEVGGKLLIHLPALGEAQRAKAQVIVMDEFFKTFPPGTDLEQLRKQYNEIKPIV